jgi:hypothetical protein
MLQVVAYKLEIPFLKKQDGTGWAHYTAPPSASDGHEQFVAAIHLVPLTHSYKCKKKKKKKNPSHLTVKIVLPNTS